MILRFVYACDIGSTQHRSGVAPKFAWVRVSPEDTSPAVGSHDIDKLVRYLARDVTSGGSIAIGFEAPLFIPVPEESQLLGKARQGEGNRPFAASVGSTVALLAIHQSAWILRELRSSVGVPCKLTTDIDAWPPVRGQVLFCWEAFVSGPAHSETDLADAATAAAEFCAHEEALSQVNSVFAEHPLSLIAAAAIWSGWATDMAILHEPTLVIKPPSPIPLNIGDA